MYRVPSLAHILRALEGRDILEILQNVCLVGVEWSILMFGRDDKQNEWGVKRIIIRGFTADFENSLNTNITDLVISLAFDPIN